MRKMVCLGILSVLCLAGCDAPEQTANIDKTEIDDMARMILEDISNGTPEESYDRYFSPQLKKSLPKEEWKIKADLYRQRLGKFDRLTRSNVSAIVIDGISEGQALYEVFWEETRGALALNLTQQSGDWEIVSLTISCPDFEKALEDARAKKPETTTAPTPE